MNFLLIITILLSCTLTANATKEDEIINLWDDKPQPSISEKNQNPSTLTQKVGKPILSAFKEVINLWDNRNPVIDDVCVKPVMAAYKELNNFWDNNIKDNSKLDRSLESNEICSKPVETKHEEVVNLWDNVNEESHHVEIPQDKPVQISEEKESKPNEAVIQTVNFQLEKDKYAGIIGRDDKQVQKYRKNPKTQASLMNIIDKTFYKIWLDMEDLIKAVGLLIIVEIFALSMAYFTNSLYKNFLPYLFTKSKNNEVKDKLIESMIAKATSLPIIEQIQIYNQLEGLEISSKNKKERSVVMLITFAELTFLLSWIHFLQKHLPTTVTFISIIRKGFTNMSNDFWKPQQSSSWLFSVDEVWGEFKFFIFLCFLMLAFIILLYLFPKLIIIPIIVICVYSVSASLTGLFFYSVGIVIFVTTSLFHYDWEIKVVCLYSMVGAFFVGYVAAITDPLNIDYVN